MQKQKTTILITILLTWLTFTDGRAINSPSIFHQKAKTVNQQSNKEPREKEDLNSLERNCNMGVAQACFTLGNMYFNGLGVSKDYSKAIELYSKACNSGLAAGCTKLGAMYVLGWGVSKNYNKAVELFSKACNSGLAAGCTSLGLMYFNGWGVSKDYSKATELFSEACILGDAKACKILYDLKGIPLQ
jgi:TPR repeat protein